MGKITDKLKKKKPVEKKEEVPQSTEVIPPRGFDMLFNNNEGAADEKTISEKTLEMALSEMFSTDGIDLKSDINMEQIHAITRGYIFSDVYKSRYMGDLCRHILELSVSKNREGRKEVVKLLQSAQGSNEEQPMQLMRRRLLE